MGFEIVRVGRDMGTNLLEVEGKPTLKYTYEGVTKVVEAVSLIAIPVQAVDISLNGVAVTITHQAEQTILQFGSDIQTHVMRQNTQWPTTQAYLEQLRGSDPHVVGNRRSGKTTALCMRAIELRIEGNSVNIVTMSDGVNSSVREVLHNVAMDLFPSGHIQLLAAITVSDLPRDCFDKYLVDEIRSVPDNVLCYIKQVHGSVTS